MDKAEIQVIKAPPVADEEDDDDESKELSEKMASLSMQSWLNIITKPISESNAESLKKEAKLTISKIETFINAIETYAKVTNSKRIRKMKSEGEGQIAKSLEKLFNDRVSLGMIIMSKINEFIRLEKLDYNRLSNSPSITKSQGSGISQYEPTLQLLIARFARVLEVRGIQHDLQVSPVARAALYEAEHKMPPPVLSSYFTEPPLEPTSHEEAEQEEKEIENAVEFLHRVVSRNNLSLMFRIIPTKDPQCYEHYYACDLDQFTVTAKGPTRLSARNNSAAKMLKLIMGEQQKGNSISTEKFALLTDDELETAIRILCLTENYALKLRKVCEMHTAHLPRFTTVSEKPVYTVRCEALGYTAMGSYKRLYVAKKIAAKKLLLQMPNEGNDKRKYETQKQFIRKDRKLKFSTRYRESTLN